MLSSDGTLNGYCSSFLTNPGAVSESYASGEIKIADSGGLGFDDLEKSDACGSFEDYTCQLW